MTQPGEFDGLVEQLLQMAKGQRESYERENGRLPDGFKFTADDAATAIQTLQARLAESEARGWQPIETAPKDGAVILLSRHSWLTDVSDLGDDPRAPEYAERLFDESAPKVYHQCWVTGGFWSSKWSNWNDGVEPCGLAGPTHWMPMPPPANPENTHG